MAKEEEDTVDGMPGTAVVAQGTERRGGGWVRSGGNGKVPTLNIVLPPNPATYLSEVEKARYAGTRPSTVASLLIKSTPAPSRLNTGVRGWGEGDVPGEGDVLMFGSHVPLVTPRPHVPVRDLASSGCRWGVSMLSRGGGGGEVGVVTQCEPVELNGPARAQPSSPLRRDYLGEIVAAHNGSTGRLHSMSRCVYTCVNAGINPRDFTEDMALSPPTSPVASDTADEDLLETLLSPLRNNCLSPLLSPLLYRNGKSPSPLESPNGDDGEEGMEWRGKRKNGGNPAPSGSGRAREGLRQQPAQVYLCVRESVCVCVCVCVCVFFFFVCLHMCVWKRGCASMCMAVCAVD